MDRKLHPSMECNFSFKLQQIKSLLNYHAWVIIAIFSTNVITYPCPNPEANLAHLCEWKRPLDFMMTSSNGNIFRVTGPLWGESTGHWWIPLTKVSEADLWCFLDRRLNKRLSKQSRCRWHHRTHFAVTVMSRWLYKVSLENSSKVFKNKYPVQFPVNVVCMHIYTVLIFPSLCVDFVSLMLLILFAGSLWFQHQDYVQNDSQD